MDPPALCPNAHARFILMQYLRVHQRRFELAFHLVEGLMAGFDKAGDAASRELHPKQIVEQLARASVRHHLPLDQSNRERLDARSILNSRFD